MTPQAIADILEKLYPAPPIPLKHNNAFELLIAVMLSAQCTDARVNQITPKLFKRAATPKAMEQLEQKEVEEIIKPLGFFRQKARSILEISKTLEKEYGGEVPASLEKLERLRGVGHKTASVVMCQAFGEPAFPVDTHIFRSARRWGLSQGASVERVEKDLKALFSIKTWAKLHLQIIYFSREYCPARGHCVAECPICSQL